MLSPRAQQQCSQTEGQLSHIRQTFRQHARRDFSQLDAAAIDHAIGRFIDLLPAGNTGDTIADACLALRQELQPLLNSKVSEPAGQNELIRIDHALRQFGESASEAIAREDREAAIILLTAVYGYLDGLFSPAALLQEAASE